MINANGYMVTHLLQVAVVSASTRMLQRELRRMAVKQATGGSYIDFKTQAGVTAVLSGLFLLAGAAGPMASDVTTSFVSTFVVDPTLQALGYGVPRFLLENVYMPWQAAMASRSRTFGYVITRTALMSFGVVGATVVAQIAIDRALRNARVSQWMRSLVGIGRAAASTFAVGALAVGGLPDGDSQSDGAWVVRVGGVAAAVVLTMQAIDGVQMLTILQRWKDVNGAGNYAEYLRPYSERAQALYTTVVGPDQAGNNVRKYIRYAMYAMILLQSSIEIYGRYFRSQGDGVALPDDWQVTLLANNGLQGPMSYENRLKKSLYAGVGKADELAYEGLRQSVKMSGTTDRAIKLADKDRYALLGLEADAKSKLKGAPQPPRADARGAGLKALEARVNSLSNEKALKQFAAERARAARARALVRGAPGPRSTRSSS